MLVEQNKKLVFQRLGFTLGYNTSNKVYIVVFILCLSLNVINLKELSVSLL